MKWKLLIIALLALGIASCGSSKDYTKQEVGLKEDLGQKNRVNLPLKQQIRQLPGVTFRNNVPVIVKNQTDIYGGTQDNFEPLYLLNDYIVGNSFNKFNIFYFFDNDSPNYFYC